MKSEVHLNITANTDKTVKALDKVTASAKELTKAIEALNDTTVTINIESKNVKRKHWYQFWK